jgi:hypothetical protein
MGGGVRHGDRRPVGEPEQDDALGAGVLDDAGEVVQVLLERRRPVDGIRRADTALVVGRHDREPTEAGEEPRVRGVGPLELDVGEHPRHPDQRGRAAAPALHGDVDAAADVEAAGLRHT